jgi:arsenate reductase
MNRDLLRRASAEGAGTALLVAVVVGSGIAAQRLSPQDTGIQLLENSIATGAGLVALILAFGPVSGAHLNPVVTLVDRFFGGISTRDTGVYIVFQVVGACFGCMLANLMFGLNAVELSTHSRSSSALWLSEIVATLGLVLTILGVVRSGRRSVAPFAVGAYITAAYWFTSSTSFANPAVTVGRSLTNTFAGIAPASVPMFVIAQLVGAGAAAMLGRFWYPSIDAEEMLVAHE